MDDEGGDEGVTREKTKRRKRTERRKEEEKKDRTLLATNKNPTPRRLGRRRRRHGSDRLYRDTPQPQSRLGVRKWTTLSRFRPLTPLGRPKGHT